MMNSVWQTNRQGSFYMPKGFPHTGGCLRAVEQGEVALLRNFVYWTVDGDRGIIQHADLRKTTISMSWKVSFRES